VKRINIIFGLIAVVSVFMLADDVAAQRKIITSKEYYEGVSRPGVKYYDKSRRVETTDETFANGMLTKSHFRVNEVLLPNRNRSYAKLTEGDKVTEVEQITIDHMQYNRKDNEPWTKVDLRKSGSGSGSGVSGGTSRQSSQYSVEATFINGRSVQLFEWLLVNGDGAELAFNEMRRWIGDDGLPYREEDVKGKLSPREETSKRVVTYEYDPNIKIEAPIK